MNQPLIQLAAEIEQHVHSSGWDQPPKLYALVETATLLATEPALADSLGEPVPGALTPIEQEPLDEGALDEILAGIAWPDEVVGCALVHEVLVLPPSVEDEAPVEATAEWAAAHPERREVRMSVAVLRDGSRATCLRLRAESPDAEDELVTGPDLAVSLSEALLATLF